MKPLMDATPKMSGMMSCLPTCRTAEHVSQAHPDKYADQIADAILDGVLDAAKMAAGDDPSSPDHPRHQRVAVEILAKDRLVVVSGEIKLGPTVAGMLDIQAIVRAGWDRVGYPDSTSVTVVNHLQRQSADIAQGVDARSDEGEGAGDQGIMVGYATDETPTSMPLEWQAARDLCHRIQSLRTESGMGWLGADTKTQVTLGSDNRPTSVIIAAQHSDAVATADIRDQLLRHAVKPVFGEEIDTRIVTVNGTGRFVVGGTIGDAGVVGRKIVVDAYGPSVPVGGGAYSGKDPTKVDRSAAYMARHIAKTAVQMGIKGAHTCLVRIAYGIGQTKPAMVTAVTDAGIDISDWVLARFDLRPRAIIDYLDLLRLGHQGSAWSYCDAASFGHYGRPNFPWERIAAVSD